MAQGLLQSRGKVIILSSLLLFSTIIHAHNRDTNAQLKKEVNSLQKQTVQQQKEINLLNKKMSFLLSQRTPRRVALHLIPKPKNTPAFDANPLNVDALPAPNLLRAISPGIALSPTTHEPHNNWLNLSSLGSALYLRHNYPNFYQIITQNSPMSFADRNICINGLVCLSGLANFDLIYTDRTGHSNTEIPAGSFHGLAVRPLFGLYDKNIIGSINNVNLFIDSGLGDWIDMHLDLAYINGSRQTISYSFNDQDLSTAYGQAAALKINQAYVLIANPAVTPLFVQLGRFNAPFGDYQPFPLTSSLTQLISESRTGGIMIGGILQNGLYAEAAWYIARQSFENSDDVYIAYNFVAHKGFGTTTVNIDNKDRNYGGKIGFRGNLIKGRLFANVNASYMADIRDTNYFQSAWDNYNLAFKLYPFISQLIENDYVYMKRAPGLALHADFAYDRFGLTADYVTALDDLNPTPAHGKISAYGLEGSVLLPMYCDIPTKLSLGYQHAQDANVFSLLAPLSPPFAPPPFPPFVYGNVLPHYRYVATFQMHILPPVTASLQWVNDHDFKAPNGSGKSSNFVLTRLTFQL